MHATIVKIQRFPIKGLSPEPLDEIALQPGDGIPLDRMYGFAQHWAKFDPANPAPLPKENFVVLLKQEALAKLNTSFDPSSGEFSCSSPDGLQRFNLATEDGRRAAENWLSDFLALANDEQPSFVHAAPHRFTDVSVVSPQMMNAVSLLNQESVRDLGQRLDAEIDPARFRANIEFTGLPAWWELDDVGSILRAGDVTFRLLKRTQRCAATEVNPVSAERDLKLPYLLRKEMGHMDMGVYAEVLTGGVLKIGEVLERQ